jgi:hypothetical protein
MQPTNIIIYLHSHTGQECVHLYHGVRRGVEGARDGTLLQWCYSGVASGVTVVSQWCYSAVTMVLQWCYSGGLEGARDGTHLS